ncbi:MAG TPA: DUF3006 domain-containing protein [Desulfosporosinus sp.]|nr:DUF3006 domain-containing protein [Desulfosporosinus sp.]
MEGIINRFEGDHAIVEFTGRRMVEVCKEFLPAGLKEGDVIRCDDGVYVFDKVDTERIKKETKGMFDKMWE